MARTEVKSTQIKQLTLLVDDMRDFGPEDGGGINLNIKAGRIRNDNTITNKAAQIVALTDNATNFVEIDSVGVATANTTAFTVGRIPIATVVTVSADITSITDKRAWVSTGGAISSAVINNQRLVATGSGDQAITGVGFQPTAILMFAQAGNGTLAQGAWGIGDSSLVDQCIFAFGGTPLFNRAGQLIRTDDGAGNSMAAELKTFDSDGFTITWIKTGTGGSTVVEFIALCLR